MIGIYKITSPSGKVYIGQSRDIDKRFAAYYRKLGNGQIKLYRSFKKYGIKTHHFEVLEECLFEELNLRERYYQDLYNVVSDSGLNCILTETEDLPRIISEETRIKLSIASRQRLLGIPKSEEHRRNMSLARKGEIKPPRSKKHCENIGKAKLGEKNGMFGKTGALSKTSKKVICTLTNQTWGSLQLLCDEKNLNPKNMSRYLSDNKRRNPTTYIYL